MENRSLSNQVVMITGAGSGIGRSLAIAFAEAGAIIVGIGRNSDKLDRVGEEVEAMKGSFVSMTADVTIENEVIALFQNVMKLHDRVDILINNAGVALGGPLEDFDFEVWKQVLDINLTAAFLCGREAFRVMKKRRSGRIINIGSVSALTPRPNAVAYNASKFGLDGLTRSIALEGRDFGVTASIIHPGNTDTPLWNGKESISQKEGLMSAETVAKVALTIATLPDGVNLYASVVFPNSMPLLGRG
ncbi:MAG TPA: SDR family oxidoreductase [Verrucomicrobia bacterium]|nr:SDR family oxidoreductase [Verrucomicrobiota bacterium]